MSNDVHLIPFKVEEVKTSFDTMPYGIKKIEAQHMWKKGERGKAANNLAEGPRRL